LIAYEETIPDKRSRIQSNRSSGKSDEGQECQSTAAGIDDEPRGAQRSRDSEDAEDKQE
jgi:hypothetical protein